MATLIKNLNLKNTAIIDVRRNDHAVGLVVTIHRSGATDHFYRGDTSEEASNAQPRRFTKAFRSSIRLSWKRDKLFSIAEVRMVEGHVVLNGTPDLQTISHVLTVSCTSR